jgi:hypothetical protein
MALSVEATQRFTDYVEHANMTDTAFGHDDALLAFVAWLWYTSRPHCARPTRSTGS